ncbi:hypothetical protein WDV06_04675 [Streptomyces racemochromogenes]|uniref:Uncharacterized protein n=1 Tax=Streptomyces racemochromogenes TaxID=67353 RepID=A0ABW7P8L3_9ACTN
MSDHSGKVTEEQVRERAAQIRERLKRWEYLTGFDVAAAMDVEAAARRALQARARPKRSAEDLLKVFRPEWEKEAAQQQLTGEALTAFRRQVLDSDVPQVFCDTDGLFNLRYHIHLNKAAVEAISWNTEVVLEALEWAAVGVPMIDELLSPLEAFIRAEVTAIQATGRANSNGQAQLVGVYPIPIPIVESDDDDWDTAGKVGDIIHHMGG